MAKPNFNELYGLALSKLGLAVDEFYDLAPIEFKYAIKNINEAETDVYKTRYEVARYLARHIWNSAGKSIKKGYEYKEPKEVGLFGWEVEEVVSKKQSVELMKQKLLRIAERSNKQFDKKKGKH